MELSNRARKWLRSQKVKCAGADRLSCGNSESLIEVLAFCDEHNIYLGTYNNKQTFILERIAFSAIQQECDFTVDFRELDRCETARLSQNEKQAGVAPADFRVLAAFVNSQLTSIYRQSQINVELDIRDLDLSSFSQLIAIENRDSFNDWHRYQVNNLFTNPLVLYRGDGEEAKWLKKLRTQWKQQKPDSPTVYFGDFDLPGLRWAMAYEQLLLPEENWLSDNLKPEHFEAKHQPFADKLVEDCPDGWRQLLHLSLKQQKALRQQWMFNTPLKLYSKSIV